MSTPKSNLLSRYTSPLRSPTLRSPTLRSPVASPRYSPGGTLYSPRTHIFSDSEYVANRISVAAKDVEIRTLRAELAATQQALDNARSDMVMKDSDIQERETILNNDLRRRQAEHEANMQHMMTEKERISAAVTVSREREHRDTINAINANHLEAMRAAERQHQESLARALAEQKTTLEADYRRALAATEEAHKRREKELRGQLETSGQRRHGELRETLELSNKRREEELQRDYAKRRATELDLLESAHKREMDAAAAAAETRLQKALDALSLEWSRKLEHQDLTASTKQRDMISMIEQRHREEMLAAEERSRDEYNALKRVHAEDCAELEAQLAATRRIKDDEKQIALQLQEAELNDSFQKDATELDIAHKHDLYDMYQTCKDEVTMTRHKTLLEVGSPRWSPYYSPRLYAADTSDSLNKLSNIIVKRETSPLRAAVISPRRTPTSRALSPYRALSPRRY